MVLDQQRLDDFDADRGLLAADLASDLRRVVRTAAHASECSDAVFVTREGPLFTAAHGFGPDLLAHAALLGSAVLALPASAVDGAAAPAGGDGPFGFVVAVPVASAEGSRGALVVADRAPRAGLSAAQTYVVRAHAAQIGLLLDHERLRRRLLCPDPAASGRAKAERPRLLEAVVHAEDAVLITGAEPIDAPEPRILQDPGTDRAALDRLRAALGRREATEVELLNGREDGAGFRAELGVVPVGDDTGGSTRWASGQRDVTGREAAEEMAARARLAEARNRALAAEIEQRRRIEAELLHAAFHDPLTGLRNRASFMERLGTAFAEARRRPGRSFAVLFLDLDRFKLVNDSLGHRAGDLLLSQVACRLEGCLRPGDTLARFGGDEFACLIEDTDGAAGGTEVAARFIEALRAPLRVLGHDVVCSCSIGVVRSAARYGQPEELLRDADAAMYRAKNGGPGTFAVFADDAPAGGFRAPDLGTELPRAIERNELRLDYQPLLDPARGRVTGVEALVRWRHPRLSLMSPAAFVPLAEDMGLVAPLGAWVLGEACQQARNWHDRFPGHPPLRVGVNVSGRELADPGYLFRLTAALDRTGLDPRCLELEIAGSVFLHQAGAVGPVLERVRALGVRIALDDFGSGHSSLASLDRFPVDTLKIDRSFVAGMLARDRTLAIVEAIVRLGRRLGLDVVAEGVETAAQLDALARMGCPQVQGFHLARPGPARGIAARLSRGASLPTRPRGRRGAPGVGAADKAGSRGRFL